LRHLADEDVSTQVRRWAVLALVRHGRPVPAEDVEELLAALQQPGGGRAGGRRGGRWVFHRPRPGPPSRARRGPPRVAPRRRGGCGAGEGGGVVGDYSPPRRGRGNPGGRRAGGRGGANCLAAGRGAIEGADGEGRPGADRRSPRVQLGGRLGGGGPGAARRGTA